MMIFFKKPIIFFNIFKLYKKCHYLIANKKNPFYLRCVIKYINNDFLSGICHRLNNKTKKKMQFIQLGECFIIV